MAKGKSTKAKPKAAAPLTPDISTPDAARAYLTTWFEAGLQGREDADKLRETFLSELAAYTDDEVLATAKQNLEAAEASAAESESDEEGEGDEPPAGSTIAEFEARMERGEGLSFAPDGAVEHHVTEHQPVKLKPTGKDVHAVDRIKVWVGETAQLFAHIETEEDTEVADMVQGIRHATRELAKRL